jgi:hypothetical protein
MVLKIESITAFVAVDREGNEGIMAFNGPLGWMPMVCADEARVESIRPMAEKVREKTGVEYRVLRFSRREEVK